MTVQARLDALGIVLPTPAAPVANYLPFKVDGTLVSISGQLPMTPDGLLFTGTVGRDLSLEEGKASARQCGINIIAQLNAATDGDLERVASIYRLGGYVNSIDGFADQPQIINAASDLMVEVFGDLGRHSRSAVGVPGLPLNAPVEIEALAVLK